MTDTISVYGLLTYIGGRARGEKERREREICASSGNTWVCQPGLQIDYLARWLLQKLWALRWSTAPRDVVTIVDVHIYASFGIPGIRVSSFVYATRRSWFTPCQNKLILGGFYTYRPSSWAFAACSRCESGSHFANVAATANCVRLCTNRLMQRFA